MANLPSLKPIEVIHKLRKAGFVFDRHAKGSHEIWYNLTTRRRTIIPNHPGKDISLRVHVCNVNPAFYSVDPDIVRTKRCYRINPWVQAAIKSVGDKLVRSFAQQLNTNRVEFYNNSKLFSM